MSLSTLSFYLTQPLPGFSFQPKKILAFLWQQRDFRFIISIFSFLPVLMLVCFVTIKNTEFSFTFSQFKTTQAYKRIVQEQPAGFGGILMNARTFSLPLYGRLTQGFSWHHPAVDLAAPLGSDIYSIAEGRVEETALYSRGYGHKVIVNHGNGIYSLYAHLGKIYVEPGEVVNKETVLGVIGMTGRTTGPHLHLEIIQEQKPVNPIKFITASL